MNKTIIAALAAAAAWTAAAGLDIDLDLKAKLEQIAAEYPTPFHVYDAKAIRENARRLKKAFSWNRGFREYFAVKANICSHTYSDNVNMFEEDPDLAEQLLDVIREFDNPAQ